MAQNTHAAEIAFTEFTARYLWRALRPLVSHHLSRRCKRCILSERFAPLDEQGVCEYCGDPIKEETARDDAVAVDESAHEALHELLGSVCETGISGFDALVLVSGGKDSAYMLHRIHKEYPELRMLALLVNNGFMSPYALDNAERVVSRFGLPYINLRLPQDFVKTAFRYTLLNLERQTDYSIVDLMDGCMTFDTAMQLAARYEIPLVICGLAKVQTEHIFGPYQIEISSEHYRAPLEKQLRTEFSEIFSEAELTFWYDPQRWIKQRQPKFLLPFTVWDPDESEVLNAVDRLGLIDKKHSRPLVTNNALIPVIGMAEVARFGYCSWELEFGRMVREGKSERNYWLNIFEMLEYSTRTGKFINRTVEQTLAALELSKVDLGIGQRLP